MYDVLIIGCGVTGAAAAFQLSRYQLKVGILERENDVALGTTKANSAILHAGYDPEPGTLMAKLNVRGVELARELWSSILGVAAREDGNNQITFNEAVYQELEDKLEELLGHSEYFFENLMVSVAFELELPKLSDPEEMWKSYVNLCNLYSIFRFAAVCGCGREVSRERLFHVLVGVSRSLLHNNIRRNQLRDEFFRNESATLAHMAILVSG